MKIQFILALLLASFCLNAYGDEVSQVVSHLEKGTENSERIITSVKKVVGLVDKIMKSIEAKFQQITDKIGSIEVQHITITKEAYDRYYNVKKYMRAARRKLRSLAERTKIACDDIMIYMDGWKNDVDKEDKKMYFQEQVFFFYYCL